MKILLIDPDKIAAHNYHQALETAGHDVRHRFDAQTAVHTIDEEQPDVVILELQMPSHNGVEFLYELRSYAEWQDIPVIVLSLVPEEDVVGAGEILSRLGIVTYLYKPRTKLRHLVQTVERLPKPVSA